MGFSSIAAQVRAKEAENLRSFIVKSLIASVALHIGVLTLGIGNLLLTKIPQVDSEPIEVAIIAPPPQEKVKTPEAKVKKTTGGGGGGGGGSSGGSSGGSAGQKSKLPQQSSIALPTNPVQQQSSPSVVQKSVLQASPQIKPLVDNFTPQPITPIKPIEPVTKLFDISPKRQIEKPKIQPQSPEISKTEVATTPEPIPSSSPRLQPKTEVATKPEPISSPSPLSQPTSAPVSSPAINTPLTPALDNDRLRKLLAQPENNASRPINTNQASPGTSTGNFVANNTANTSASSTGSGNGADNDNLTTNGTSTESGINKIPTGTSIGNGSGTVSGTGSGRGSGHGSGTGSGTGSNTGNGYEIKPQEEKKIATAPTPSKPPEINDTDLKLNPADCEECRITYPETAKIRGIEGNPEVAIDYDSQGRVTKVRLTRSSGSDELDNALLSQARDFKLKPSESGKQGVRVSGNYAIKGSRRHRKLQAQKRQREEKRRQRQAEARQREAQEQKRENPVSASPQTEENSRPLGTRETITDVAPKNPNRRTPAEKPGEIKAPRLRRNESNDAEEVPKPLPRQVESDNSIESEISPSPAGNSEETDRKQQRLREILGRPQQESDLLPAPSPTEPAQSEEKPATNDGN